MYMLRLMLCNELWTVLVVDNIKNAPVWSSIFIVRASGIEIHEYFPPVAVIGFVQTTYTVNEVEDMDSEVEVCVHLLSGTIAPGVSVDYSLQYIETDAKQGRSRCKVMGISSFGYT